MSIYFVVPKDKTTQRMVNVSTSAGKWDNLVLFNDAYIIEVPKDLCDCLMDYPMYTQDEILDLLDNTEEEKTAWWAKLLSLFSRV